MKPKLILCLALVLSGCSIGYSINVVEPPQQHNPWKPPATDLPTNLISSAKFLFDLGLADPRGCQYREFETVIGYDIPSVKAHGWILPAKSGQTRQFAVGWNGLVYPAISVGAKTDLKQDVETLLPEKEIWSKAASTNWFAAQGPWGYWVSPESNSISETNLTAVKVMLLLRLGEVKLAQEYWDAGYVTNAATNAAFKSKEDTKDPFRQLAYGWAWSLLDRAVSAHIRGDDALALADCQQLNHAWPELENEASRRGFTRSRYSFYSQDFKEEENVPYFDFLNPLPALLADQERRAKEPPHQTVLQIGQDKFPDGSKRIAALIADLDEVAARQWMYPGGVPLNLDPTVEALVAEGDDAVEALLDCMENDPRLTRSRISLSGRPDFHRDLIPVREAARIALSEILKVNFKTVAEYRDYWQKYEQNKKVRGK
jgi:hypothetical protein